MKKICYFVFTILFSCLLINCVNAECTNEELTLLKQEANKIKVSYKHLGVVEDDEGIAAYDRFNLTFKNVSDDFYIELFNFSYTKYPEDGVITDVFTTGNWKFGIYSDKCEEKLLDISVNLPKFNIYSLDPLCDGISGEDFALCGKYYGYDISYDSFKQRVENYIKSGKHDSDKTINNDEHDLVYYFNIVIEYVINHFLYFSCGFILAFIIIILFLIIKKKRSRGVLR